MARLSIHIWQYNDGMYKQITSGPVRDDDISWSLDGEKIYFTRYTITTSMTPSAFGGLDFSSDKPTVHVGNGNIWSIDANGRNLKQLTFDNGNSFNFAPSPSTDGKKVLFSKNNFDPETGDQQWSLYVMDSDGSNQKHLIDEALHGQWSPDGNMIAYLSSTPGDIVLANTKGEFIRQLTHDAQVAFAPSWSPDQEYLVYSNMNPQPNMGDSMMLTQQTSNYTASDIMIVSSSGKKAPVKISDGGLSNTFPRWVSGN